MDAGTTQPPPCDSIGDGPASGLISWVGFAAGPLLALLAYTLLPSATSGGPGLSDDGRAVVALAVLMACWWMTEAVPVPATALLPIVLLPALGISSVAAATAPFGDELIFLFLGGFLLGAAMQKCGLHRRLALWTVRLVGVKPRRMILGFMIASAVISMWVSNTATAMMMMPIGLSVIALVFGQLGIEKFDPNMRRDIAGPNFATCLMLGIAYAASIGGVGTLIGTPPNVVLASQVPEQFGGHQLGFATYMRIGIPIVAIMLPLTWLFLTCVAFPVRLKSIPGGRELIRDELRSLGPMTRAEIMVLIVFVLTATLWIVRQPLVDALGLTFDYRGKPVPALTDASIAIAAALTLFLLPVSPRRREFVLDWRAAQSVPWGVLILFGGGLSLAAAMGATGVNDFLADSVRGLSIHPLLLILTVVTALVFLSEVASNTALATAILPVLGAPAVALGVHPYLIMLPAAIACSLAFMLPAGTPPNAIVFATGHVTMRQMIKAGFWLNWIGIALVTLLTYFLGGPLLGEDLSRVPDWAAHRAPGP